MIVIFRHTTIAILFLFYNVSTFNLLLGQDCNGGAITTKESYLYGRFEVRMQSVEGSGIVSSFFLYNIEVGCNWPQQNNEIDIEMTGNSQEIFFTTHHPGTEQPWFYGESFSFDFNPHRTLQNYAIEWEPGIVRWFVNDELTYVQDEPEAEDLKYPMAILMNLWAGAEAWAGKWDPSVLPQNAVYDYVRYYRYSPGQGDAGTNNNFKLEWEDSFDFLDESRWDVSDFTKLDNYCTFRSMNVSVSDGLLYLTIDEPQPSNHTAAVTFSVNTRDQNLAPTDQIYLNGSFNNWCGTCNSMSEENGVWSITLELSPGRYEYLFTLNNWQETGGAPLNSSCDFVPCDEFENYGFLISESTPEVVLDTYCWGTCSKCLSTRVNAIDPDKTKTLLKVFDLLGREVVPVRDQILLYFYSDGTVEKRIHLGH